MLLLALAAPAYIEDAAAAVAWTFQHIGNYGGSVKKYDIDANRIAAVIPFSGQAITHFTIR
ncbi:MAG: alpha/beta hydrolase [Mucilaginibacter sp.]|nr:alpha/beta hydrolase [Mucilaginibacter sp.]